MAAYAATAKANKVQSNNGIHIDCKGVVTALNEENRSYKKCIMSGGMHTDFLKAIIANEATGASRKPRATKVKAHQTWKEDFTAEEKVHFIGNEMAVQMAKSGAGLHPQPAEGE